MRTDNCKSASCKEPCEFSLQWCDAVTMRSMTEQFFLLRKDWTKRHEFILACHWVKPLVADVAEQHIGRCLWADIKMLTEP